MGSKLMLSLDSPVVFFDIFDTLVTRACGSPQSVFEYVEQRAVDEGLAAWGFAAKRLDAEKESIEAVGAGKMRLEDIYLRLERGFSREVAKQLMDYELQAEIDFCIPVPSGIDLFNHCVQSCKLVVLASDMYLSKEAIEKILANCGIEGYSKLYVSCEYGETKRNGSLFKLAMVDLNVQAGDITHLGDDLFSDYLSPRKLGLNATLLRFGKPISPLRVFVDRMARNIFPSQKTKCFANRYETVNPSVCYKVGYSILGPILAKFCEWIHERKEDEGIDKLFFVARDGYLMKRFYEILYSDEQCEYLLASRRSTTVPLLWLNEGLEGFVGTAGLGYEMQLSELLTRLGLDGDEAEELSLKYGFVPSDRLRVDDLARNEKFASLFGDVAPAVKKNSRLEFEAMGAYFKSAFKGCRVVGFVDLGWRGSIQHALETAFVELGMDIAVKGFYLGVSPKSRWVDRQDMRGFLFSKGKEERAASDEEWFNALVEAFFVAPHGSARRYRLDDSNRATIDFESYEADGENVSSPLFAVQDAALEFASDYKTRNWSRYNFIDIMDAAKALYSLGLKPSREEADVLGDCVFAYQEILPLAKPSRTLFHYLINPRDLVSEMSVCYWKPAFLNRLLKLPINYWRILKTAKRLFRGNNG
ncbi:hypothetical protein [Paraeggerthella sp. Marseille-Q4926]|uniref:HAD family hydrolase n=1 Tax=Paraeggerthella sp. Marseille-Q4926 TaxID=2866587 RepID=UPI001CE4A547|nr:hypothetical protein [Paraeggerthella sp. Marseille-Q4926]